jgi:hypothetical protein
VSKRSLLLSLGAGLLGGVLSHSLIPQLVHAQSQTLPAKVVRAESFVLVNEKGVVLGKLSYDEGRPALKLFDEQGKEIWSAGGKIGIRTASAGH